MKDKEIREIIFCAFIQVWALVGLFAVNDFQRIFSIIMIIVILWLMFMKGD